MTIYFWDDGSGPKPLFRDLDGNGPKIAKGPECCCEEDNCGCGCDLFSDGGSECPGKPLLDVTVSGGLTGSGTLSPQTGDPGCCEFIYVDFELSGPGETEWNPSEIKVYCEGTTLQDIKCSIKEYAAVDCELAEDVRTPDTVSCSPKFQATYTFTIASVPGESCSDAGTTVTVVVSEQ